jgi:hypothetical protein
MVIPMCFKVGIEPNRDAARIFALRMVVSKLNNGNGTGLQ